MPRRITPLADLKAVYMIVRLLRTVEPEVAHAHTPKGGLLGMISAWFARTPVRIYHMRGLPYMTATGRKRALLMTTERVSCRLAHRVFCVSHSLREVAIRDGICPPEKTVVFGGGSGQGVDAAGRFDPERFDLPTYREGFPNVPLEAAAMGLPVVATRIPGCVEAVQDGVTGTLVPPRDAGALLEAIHQEYVTQLRERGIEPPTPREEIHAV